LLLGIIASVAVYMAPPRLSLQMTVKPARPVYEEHTPDIPEGAEPCLDAIRVFNRWLRECKDNCGACPQHYSPGSLIPCNLLAAVRASFPNGDPFTYVVGSLTGEVRLLNEVVRENNQLRLQEETRQNPLFKYFMLLLTVPFQAAIYFTVLQILAYVVSL
ncbi:hypothetical protein KJ632_05965, partial [Patescibacteria group bacterium]|nr:hypothetical protein [Patescibacteria group bacterium]